MENRGRKKGFKCRKWEEHELIVMNSTYGIIPTRHIARALNRSMASIKLKAQKLGLHSDFKGIKNPMWKEDVGYTALHNWIRRNKPKPALCEDCNKEKPKDLANISGEYKRDVQDFKWICRRCHMKEDGRLETIKKTQFKKGSVSKRWL